MSKVKCECGSFSEEYEHDRSLLEIARQHAKDHVSDVLFEAMDQTVLPEDLPVTITYEGNPEPQTVVVRVELTARVLNPRGE